MRGDRRRPSRGFEVVDPATKRDVSAPVAWFEFVPLLWTVDEIKCGPQGLDLVALHLRRTPRSCDGSVDQLSGRGRAKACLLTDPDAQGLRHMP